MTQAEFGEITITDVLETAQGFLDVAAVIHKLGFSMWLQWILGCYSISQRGSNVSWGGSNGLQWF